MNKHCLDGMFTNWSTTETRLQQFNSGTECATSGGEPSIVQQFCGGGAST